MVEQPPILANPIDRRPIHLTMLTRRRRSTEIFAGRGRGPGYRVRRARALRRVLLFLTIPLGVALLILGFNGLRSMIEPDANHLTILGHASEPLPGAIVTAENGRQTTSAEGGAAFLVFDPPTTLEVVADGYEPATYEVEAMPADGALYLQMVPLVLQGRVMDRHGNGVVGAEVTVGEHSAQTVEFGSFEIVGAPPGEVTISKSAWQDLSFIWDGDEERVDVEMEPFIVRALRVYGFSASDDETFDELLRIADQTAINALVFDTKSEGGEVLYLSQNQDALESKAILNLYDVEKRLTQAKEHGLYTITRIVTFQDFFMAEHKPQHAIMNVATGRPWTNWKGIGWMDPTDEGAWEYPIALGLEACALGFDEIQFDYVRFPTDGDLSTTSYDDPNVADQAVRVETVAGFLAEARRRINEAGCAVSADLFAILLSVQNDQGLGQKVEEISWTVDAISPMVYPSHYSPGWLGFDDPNDHPAQVVEDALRSGLNRSEGGALIRPWLQGFGWTTEQVQESIMTAEELSSGWMLWHASSEYQLEWIPDL